MTDDRPSITFEPLTAADMAMMSRWLHQPHMTTWWGDPETELGYIRDMIEGRDTTRPFIFFINGHPTGYIQYWLIADYQDGPLADDYPWLRALAPQTIGVDLSIGEPDLLSQGLGSAVLAHFVAWLRTQGHDIIIIDPDPANRRAVRAYEKAGFRAIPELVGKSGDSLIMRHWPMTEDGKR